MPLGNWRMGQGARTVTCAGGAARHAGVDETGSGFAGEPLPECLADRRLPRREVQPVRALG